MDRSKPRAVNPVPEFSDRARNEAQDMRFLVVANPCRSWRGALMRSVVSGQAENPQVLAENASEYISLSSRLHGPSGA